MTSPQLKPEDVTILSENPITSFPRPGQPELNIALSYSLRGGIPRTVFVPLETLPDKLWEATHKDGPPPSKDLVKDGDKARLVAIISNEQRIKQRPATRQLSI